MLCEECSQQMDYEYPSQYRCPRCGKTVSKPKFVVSNSMKVY
ncbi:MAG: hypothetical protein ABSD42_06840 [Candidatus Bathyarchaeia archaeon]